MEPSIPDPTQLPDQLILEFIPIPDDLLSAAVFLRQIVEGGSYQVVMLNGSPFQPTHDPDGDLLNKYLVILYRSEKDPSKSWPRYQVTRVGPDDWIVTQFQ